MRRGQVGSNNKAAINLSMVFTVVERCNIDVSMVFTIVEATSTLVWYLQYLSDVGESKVDHSM